MMNDADRWQHIEDLCHAALERDASERSAFLTAACGEDAALRREVEALLAHARTAEGFLGEPAPAVVARDWARDTRSLTGEVIGHYRIVERLGGGGMGVVYRADDTKLARPVALKFLPADATRDEDAKRRFVVEAQAASALDHPNICTIYEVDETPEGLMFIAMAYYAGETLKAKIDRGPLTLDKAIDYAMQIAQGLVKAHAAGIVHRDIKPANVLVTNDGLVKLLDFGIAKLVAQAGATQTGTTLGTPAYMSPEQVRGAHVDARSDVWSLGVVMYEMVAGRLPFLGEHPQAIAVAAAPEPLTALRTGVPRDLERIVDRALAKNPDDRYQTSADLLSELRRFQRDTPTRAVAVGEGRTAATAPRWVGRRGALGAGVAALAGGAVAAFFATTWRATDTGLPRLTNPVQVAGSVGIEVEPSWSPDGRTLVYQSDQSGSNDIWMAQLGAGGAINRTADFTGGDGVPRWSPDGTEIAFWSARDGAGVFLMPSLGGTPRKIAPARPEVARAAAWSPDGGQIAYPVRAGAVENPTGPQVGRPSLEILDLRRAATRRVAVPPGGGGCCLDTTWSPDGRLIAFVQANSRNNQTSRLWVLRLADEQSMAITDGRMNDWSPTWTRDSRALVFVSNRGGTMDLWHQRLTSDGHAQGDPDRLSTGLEVQQAAFSPGGERLAYSRGRRVSNVWRVPVLPDRPATWADATQITLDQAHIEYFDVSRDGKWLAVQSDRSGNPDIWILPADGGDMQPFAMDPTPDWSPAWSPDGRQLVFYSNRSGKRELWIQPVGGGAARNLGLGIFPRWSADATEIFANGQGGIVVRKVAGGEPKLIVKFRGSGGDGQFTPSPDGKWLAFGEPVDRRIWRAPVAGGGGVAVTRGQGNAPYWSPDGRTIFFTSLRDRPGGTYEVERTGTNVWSVSADGANERAVTNLTGRRGFLGTTIAANGRWVYFTWREDIGDIWVMDVERAKR